MTKKDTLKLLNEAQAILDENQVNWCEHISRRDNTQIFEMCFELRSIIERIDKEYND
jgi:hypothetical protein